MNNCVMYAHVDYVCMVILLTFVILLSIFSCVLSFYVMVKKVIPCSLVLICVDVIMSD